MAAHSSTLAWKIAWTEEPGGDYGPWGHTELDMAERLHTHTHTHTHTPIQERVVESKKLQKSAEEVTVPLTTEVLVAMIQLYKNKQRTTCTTKQIMLKPQTRLGIVQSLSSLVYRCL